MSLKRLLLIDDEEPFTRLVKLNLEETGRYTVRLKDDPEGLEHAVKELRALATAALPDSR